MFLDKFVPSPYKTGKLPKKEEKMMISHSQQKFFWRKPIMTNKLKKIILYEMMYRKENKMQGYL